MNLDEFVNSLSQTLTLTMPFALIEIFVCGVRKWANL